MQNENRLLSPIALLFVIAAHALLYWLLISIKPPELPPEPPGLSFVDLGEIGGGGLLIVAGGDLRGGHVDTQAAGHGGKIRGLNVLRPAPGALKRTAVKLSKICNDLRLLSSGPRAGLKEINLPEMQAGSSIMPAKVNPVIPEVVNQVCFKVIGNDTTITFAAEAGQLQLNVMEPVIAQSMFESISLLGNAAVTLADKCVRGITVNREICERYVFNSIGLVTYLNPYIGHENGDLVGKICAQTGKTVREVVLERQLLSEAELDRILSPQNLANPHL